MASEKMLKISEELYERILKEVLLKRAQARSLYILKSMDKTEAQMRQKLKEGTYPEKVIEEVIGWLYGFHYLDDRRYAENVCFPEKVQQKPKTDDAGPGTGGVFPRDTGRKPY